MSPAAFCTKQKQGEEKNTGEIPTEKTLRRRKNLTLPALIGRFRSPVKGSPRTCWIFTI